MINVIYNIINPTVLVNPDCIKENNDIEKFTDNVSFITTIRIEHNECVNKFNSKE